MKKIIALIVLIMTLNSCAEKIVINREVDSTEYGKMLLGNQSLDQFQKEPYKAWYDENYNIYPVDKNTLAELKKEKLNYEIEKFFNYHNKHNLSLDQLQRIKDIINEDSK